MFTPNCTTINLVSREPGSSLSSPSFDLDNITIDRSYGKIVAETVWGALNGLETFSQLLYPTEDNYVSITHRRSVSTERIV